MNYYRARMPAKHLPGKTVYFEDRDIQPDGEDVTFPRQAGDAAIWMFPGNVTRWLAMADMRASKGLRVLVEVDDNYTRQPSRPQISAWLSSRDRSGGDQASYACHRAIVSSNAVDGIVVSTPHLGSVYEQFGKPVYVCPNSIDPADWGDTQAEHAPGDVLRVGWAGSASHAYDLADIRPALDWASRQAATEVVVLGQLEIVPGARQVPWTDSLAEYRRNIGELDVILCPLRSNEWADCKSDVKALEGAMGLALPVVSKTEPFRPWWDRGYVAETPKDFVKVVKHLVSHREETRKAAYEAREYVLAERTIDKHIHKWREAIGA